MIELKQVQVVVIGGGPGGYTAAFRAADLGLQVALVERFETLGGVCLNVGCIPSKALLHTARTLDEAKEAEICGVHFGAPKIDVTALRGWKNSIIKRLTTGLAALAKKRKVTIMTGDAQFIDSHTLAIKTPTGTQTLAFQHAIIAVGSESMSLPFIPEDERIFSSTGALELRDVKGDLFVLGGGIIGLEMATVYAALGVSVTVIESTDQLIPAADVDLVQVLHKRLKKKGVTVLLKTKMIKVSAKKIGLEVTLLHADKDTPNSFAKRRTAGPA
jgi:dihydrolipoamide dehydrogenase